MKIASTLLATLGLAGALLSGCGGGGDDSTKTAPNLYQGSYSGTWSSPSLNQTGGFTMKIIASGHFAEGSQMTIDQLGISGELLGRIGYNGRFDYDDQPNPEGTGADFLAQGIYEFHQGTMTKGLDGRIRGNFVIRTFNEEYPATFVLLPGG